jgi:hypothetical protein
MTESEWLAEPNFAALVQHAEGQLSERRRRLLAAGFCRAAGPLLDHPELLASLDMIEQYADGLVSAAELEKARANARVVAVQLYEEYVRWSESDPRQGPNPMLRHQVAWAVAFAGTTPLPVSAVGTKVAEAPNQPDGIVELVTDTRSSSGQDFGPALRAVVHDVVGNPFRPVTVDPGWLTERVVSPARRMYATRDFSAMPQLADALREAGCTDEAVLAHCRDSGHVHVRGCWLLDMLLGKS